MQWIQGQNYELQSELCELQEKSRALEEESRALLEKNKELVDQAEKERKVIVKFNTCIMLMLDLLYMYTCMCCNAECLLIFRNS